MERRLSVLTRASASGPQDRNPTHPAGTRRRVDAQHNQGEERMGDDDLDMTLALVRHQVAALPESHGEAVTLHFFGGLPFDMLACELGIPIGAVKQRVLRGLHALRRRLELAGCALSLPVLARLLAKAGSEESCLAISTRHFALLNSTRAAGRLGLPASRAMRVAIRFGAAAILMAAASVAAWWLLD